MVLKINVVSSTKCFLFNKVVSFILSKFSFDFPLFFYVFVVEFLRACSCLLVFLVDSNDIIASIRQRSHIKSLFVSMIHQT